MARSRTSRSKTTAAAPPDSGRRAFLTFTAPAAGAAGLIAAAPRAQAATPCEPQPQDDDGGSPTAHREAYYRRARF